MKLIDDTIKVETREEIEQLLTILNQWIKDHPQDKEAMDIAFSLKDKLEAMYSIW